MSFDAQQVRFLQRLVEARYTERRCGAVSQYLSEHYSIGVIVGQTVLYRPEHHAAAAGLLKSHDLPVNALQNGASRAEVAVYGGLSEKSQSMAPHAQSVAVKFMGACELDGHPLSTPAGAYLVLRPNEAVRVRCARILVVENFETFRALESYSWLALKEPTMVVFRGDTIYPIGDAAGVISSRMEPLLAFFDFDPAGLAMANALPAHRLERLVLPDLSWLTTSADTARGRQLYADHAGIYADVLDQAVHPDIREAWALCRRLRSAVTQERMLGAPPVRAR